jgi:phosphoribosyl 1,2-cyclic phosphate phosphodiesterase
VETIGFLFRRRGKSLCAYVSDLKEAPPETVELMQGVDTLVVDALRHTPHPTHMNLEEALAFRLLVRPRITWFTHFHCEVMHARDEPKMPPDVRFAYDGLKLMW